MNWFRKLFSREAKYLEQEKAKTSPTTSIAPTAIDIIGKALLTPQDKQPNIRIYMKERLWD